MPPITLSILPKNKLAKVSNNKLILPDFDPSFTVSIAEYDKEYQSIADEKEAIRKANAELKRELDNVNMPSTIKFSVKQLIALQKENVDKLKHLETKLTTLNKKYADVHWTLQTITDGQPIFGTNPKHVEFGQGYKSKFVTMPTMLSGGQLVWLEAYHESEGPTGKTPYGWFVCLTGEPDVIAAEWCNNQGTPIPEAELKKVAYGSTLYLHIYTKALCGRNIAITLMDHYMIGGNQPLQLNENEGGVPKPTGGKPKQELKFTRQVKPMRAKAGAGKGIIAALFDPDPAPFVQKVELAVYIDPFWQWQDRGTLKIYYNIAFDDTKAPFTTSDYVEVDPSLPMQLTSGAQTGNSPVLVSDGKTNTPEKRTKINFTFCVCIDGTLNSKYNSEARIAWEKNEVSKWTTEKDNPANNQIVEDNLQYRGGKKHDEDKMDAFIKSGSDGGQKYHYNKDSSYENDLSNPAIIYNYYDDKKNFNSTNKVFRVYAEGMGTNTLAKDGDEKNLKPEDYKIDDLSGYAFGTGSSGMRQRVRRAIELMVGKITINTAKECIGKITIDVFGFSRGAASARHFVSNILYPSYPATIVYNAAPVTSGSVYLPTSGSDSTTLKDHFGFDIDSKKYNTANPLLPTYGYLGYLLAEKKGYDMTTAPSVRFAGLYDSVPHEGLGQDNVKEMGLDDIAKADYTVHLAAGDEHRKNFSLVDISCVTGVRGGRNSRGIELFLPGVHCDVGGSYVEGRGEVNSRLLVNDAWTLEDLEAEQKRLIRQGWYKAGELTIHDDTLTRKAIKGVIYHGTKSMVLSGIRQQLSNRYSYIPLYIMVKFCMNKGVSVVEGTIYEKYQLISTSYSNAALLNRIKDRLWGYAFDNESRYEFVKLPRAIYTDGSYWPSAAERKAEKLIDDTNRQIEKQEAEVNADLMQLRHNYLHWNAEYGDGENMVDSMKGFFAQPNEPNFDGDRKRKRHIRP